MLQLRKGTAVLVTGTPGTGKTTIGRLLARSLNADYLNPATLFRREKRDSEYDENRKARILPPTRLRDLLRSVAGSTNRGLIIDSHITFEIGPSPRVERTVVLRCNPVVLERRLKRKRWSKRKISENVLAEILDICLWEAVENYGWRKVSEIDTTNSNAEEVVRQAIRAIRRRRIQKRPRVHWLSALRHQGMLEHYLM